MADKTINNNNTNQNSGESSEDENELKAKSRKKWTHKETMSLIQARGSPKWMMEFEKAKHKKKLWIQISDELVAEGINRNGYQLSEKWIRLESEFKVYLDASKKSGAEKPTWDYFDLMGHVLNNKAKAKPRSLLSIGTCNLQEFKSIDTNIKDNKSKKNKYISSHQDEESPRSESRSPSPSISQDSQVLLLHSLNSTNDIYKESSQCESPSTSDASDTSTKRKIKKKKRVDNFAPILDAMEKSRNLIAEESRKSRESIEKLLTRVLDVISENKKSI